MKNHSIKMNVQNNTGIKLHKKIIIPVTASVAVILLIILYFTMILPNGGLLVNGIVKQDGKPLGNIDVRLYRIIDLETGMVIEMASTKTDPQGRYKVNGLKLIDLYLVEAGPTESEWRKTGGYYGSRIIDLHIPDDGKDLEIIMTREG
ncbi:MAG: hypothetical protein JXJ04_18505 [Spirochaetales bacterium]|nr:hypothetical protein [Spirochaetales bacterium]